MAAKEPKVEFYPDEDGKRRWRYVAKNGRIRSDSAQGYRRRIDVIADAEDVMFRKVVFEPDRVDLCPVPAIKGVWLEEDSRR